jgi:hypothetical protein
MINEQSKQRQSKKQHKKVVTGTAQSSFHDINQLTFHYGTAPKQVPMNRQ